MPARHVLIVGQNDAVNRLLQDFLRPGIQDVQIAVSHEQVVKKLQVGNFDLVILSFSTEAIWRIICQSIHQITQAPILLVLESNQSAYIVSALRFGANDFILLPCDRPTLLARIYVMLDQESNREQFPQVQNGQSLFDDGYLRVDLQRRRVEVNGERISLTHAEYEILACLVRHAGQVLTYEQIAKQVFELDENKSHSALHTHISHLRTKLEKDVRHPRYVQTEYGTGYYFG